MPLPIASLYWAKTLKDGQPGLSVRDHCLNVGCVAEALLTQMPACIRSLLPAGAATLAALHDIGKISAGFQVKCPAWLQQQGLMETSSQKRWATGAERDHAKVTQYVLQKAMPAPLWGIAAGVHHGRIFGRYVRQIESIPECHAWETPAREALMEELISVFGPLPCDPPEKDLVSLWYLAGLISVADWIGSNIAFFASECGLSVELSRDTATRALQQIRWGGGEFHEADFASLFEGFTPKTLQSELHRQSTRPGLFVVEGPMGCGKTEAALWAAHRLIAAEVNGGIYFALPTQVTSNRIHRRVQQFMAKALANSATLRLAHGASWLDDLQTLVLHPSVTGDADSQEDVREGRSWFASSKHALLARFGVGTIDQALQGVVAVKHFFVRRFGLAGKVVILDEIHSYDVYTGTLITRLIRELLALRCTVIVLSATLTLARRKELIEAGGGDPQEVVSTAYPLVTVARTDERVEEVAVAEGQSRSVKLRTEAFSEIEIIEECVARAEAGQHVLYLRNTVVEAQATYCLIKASVREDRAEVGLLHSRFPFFRRQELEGYWLERLGRQRSADGKGSILIATQVVEQSVDIDLDFIVTDLAPTDMLLQRMGRLWRHQRTDRGAHQPEFWINSPLVDGQWDVRQIKAALGKSGLVYAPYVLLRTAEVFAARAAITLPGEIRQVLEMTYAERLPTDEPPAWQILRSALEAARQEDTALAESVTRVLGQQSQQDLEGKLTRREGAPTRDLVLLRKCEPIAPHRWRITALDGESIEASAFEWSLTVARLLHRNLVRAPRFAVPPQTMPAWLKLHTHGITAWALVKEGGLCELPQAESPSAFGYSPLLGLHTRVDKPQSRFTEDDDESDY